MDIAALIGVIIGFASIILAYAMDGGHLSALLAPTAALIVFGGTLGTLAVSYRLEDLKKLPKCLKVIFTNQKLDFVGTYTILVDSAEKARREGLLSLEENINAIEDKYLRQGLQLVVDGTDPELTRSILESEIYAMESRHKVGISMFEAAGGYAPTMGIIGTVMGLVHVLGNLTNPDALGPSIAVAFIATLYGVGSANLLWLPMGGKLKIKSKSEASLRELVMDAVLSIQAGENPSLIREKLKVHLGPSADALLTGNASASKTRMTEEAA